MMARMTMRQSKSVLHFPPRGGAGGSWFVRWFVLMRALARSPLCAAHSQNSSAVQRTLSGLSIAGVLPHSSVHQAADSSDDVSAGSGWKPETARVATVARPLSLGERLSDALQNVTSREASPRRDVDTRRRRRSIVGTPRYPLGCSDGPFWRNTDSPARTPVFFFFQTDSLTSVSGASAGSNGANANVPSHPRGNPVAGGADRGSSGTVEASGANDHTQAGSGVVGTSMATDRLLVSDLVGPAPPNISGTRQGSAGQRVRLRGEQIRLAPAKGRSRLRLVFSMFMFTFTLSLLFVYFIQRQGEKKAYDLLETVGAMRVVQGDELKKIFGIDGSEQGFSGTPLSPGLLMRLQGRVVAKPGASLNAPFSGRACVRYSASAAKVKHDDGVHPPPIAFHAAGNDFKLVLSDTPELVLTVQGRDVTLFNIASGQQKCEESFAEASEACRGFVLAHLLTHGCGASKGSASLAECVDLSSDATMIEFCECALLVDAEVTCIGEVVRERNGDLSLYPWQPQRQSLPPQQKKRTTNMGAAGPPWFDQASTWMQAARPPEGAKDADASAVGPLAAAYDGLGRKQSLVGKVLVSDDPSLTGRAALWHS